MKIAEYLKNIKPSATLSVNAKAMDLRAQGRDIISLSVGEPDFPTPDHVCEAAKKAIDERFTRYTQVPGIPELRTAVAGYFSKFYGINPSMESTIVTNGGKQALFSLFQAMLDPGDEVLIPSPYWVSYPAMVKMSGGVPVFVPTTMANNFKATPNDLEKMVTSRTRILIINSPSNPTGMQYSQDELEAILEFAVSRNIFVISDEIYDRLVYSPSKPVSMSKGWEKYPDMVAIINGLSKSFAMTGWRVGYILAHEELIKIVSKIQSQSTSNICTITQKAALAALEGPWDFVDTMNVHFERRRDLAVSIMEQWDNVSVIKPDGAFYLFIDVHKLYKDKCNSSAAFCEMMLEKAGVALVPGSAFGDDNCVRISYAVDDKVLIKALDQMKAALT